MKTEELDAIREFIVEMIITNQDIMFDDTIRNGFALDLVEVIASLYEKLHQEVTGEPYRYFFHFANKVGSWVEDDLFDKEEGDHTV